MKAPGCRGAALPIVDVTIPGRASFLDGISVTFSLMPLFLGLLVVLGMFWTRRLSLLCAVFFWLIILVVCEMLKGMIPGERPFGSCATSSGHGPTVVIAAYAFITWMTLEMTFHQQHILRLYRLGYLVGAAMLLGPVPAARTRLRDHYALQLGIGIIIGVAAGIIWFLLMHFVIGGKVLRWIGLLKARVKCLQFVNIKNDYFTSKEAYLEQMTRYREGGVDGYVDAEELGATAPEEGEEDNEAHQQARTDIFGEVLSDEDDMSEVSSFDGGDFSPRSPRDNGTNEAKSKKKGKGKPSPLTAVISDQHSASGIGSPVIIPTPNDSTPATGTNSATGGHTSGTADEPSPLGGFVPPPSHVVQPKPDKNNNSSSQSSPTTAPAKSALKHSTNQFHSSSGAGGEQSPRSQSGKQSDQNEHSERPGVRAGFVAFAASDDE